MFTTQDALRNLYPQVEWRAVTGMRDRLSHGYDAIDDEILWKAVHEQLPVPVGTLEQMLRDLNSRGWR